MEVGFRINYGHIVVQTSLQERCNNEVEIVQIESERTVADST